MELEPLPKVTFLPAQLTELVIKNWTGDIIDFEKNGQICKVYHGQGTCEFREGHTFKGEMKHGLLHGKGEFIWADGTRYKGEFRENEITGAGRYDWTDGSYYEGQVVNGLRQGKGTYTNTKEGVVYEGQWLAGLRHGQGILRYKNGSVYEGSWEKGMKSGQGKMTYASGNYYEGDWRLNKRNGDGTMFWLTSNEKYTGNWEDNYQSGYGTHIWLESAQGDNKLLRNRYVGNWKLGLRSGQGTFYYSNGSKYEGEWKENLKHGQGVFTFEDGTCYEGPFESDRMINRNIGGGIPAPVNLKESAHITEKNAKNTEVKSPEKQIIKPQQTTKSNNLNVTMNTTSGAGGTTTGKFSSVKGNASKREVEQNPFKTLLDITDLIEMEGQTSVGGPKEIEKEVQNIMLRNNSDLKAWYKLYSRKVEAQKSEESFSMTLRQVWRFLRDCQIIGPDCTISQFDRVYVQGRKNHFDLVPKNNEVKRILPSSGRKLGPVVNDGSSDEEEDDMSNPDQSQLEDLHLPSKVVLQRQFFEALVRAAAIKYANRSDLPTLAEKVEFLFKAKLLPNATKNKAKSIEEEKQFKLAERLFEEQDSRLKEAYSLFAHLTAHSGFRDHTLLIEDALEMFRKAAIIPGKDGKSTPLKLEDVIASIERFYSPEQKLDTKLHSEELFKGFLELHPDLIPTRIQHLKEMSQQTPEEAEHQDPHVAEERRRKEDEEIREARAKWRKQVICEHLVYLRGVEINYFEFKEVLFDLGLNKLKDLTDPKRTGKVKLVLNKFLEDIFLRRIGALIRSSKGDSKLHLDQVQTTVASASRKWPESEKDKIIRLKMEERKRQEEEQRMREEEERRQQHELLNMSAEDIPAMDEAQLEEYRLKKAQEEEMIRMEQEGEQDEEEEEEEGGQHEEEDEDNLDDEDY